MFGQHFKKKLSAYAHGELSPEETGRVASHLAACAKCRREFETVRLGIRLAESLPTRTAPPALWDNIEAALARSDRAGVATGEREPERALQPTPRRQFSFGFPRQPAAAYGFAALLVVACAGFWLYLRSTPAAWEVARVEGAPTIESNRMGKTGRLAVGQWLETDAASRARIKVADIGQVDIDPGTRIRLVETRLTEHRLELARGRMHATIHAPPRLFFVDTPSAVAADLGCAYTLEVDDGGSSLLRVTSGWVALETGGRGHESIVPAGAACATQPGTGAGTPFFEDAAPDFLSALKKFDFRHGDAEEIATVLAESRPRDTLTLWHLLSRVEGFERSRVYERLAGFSPPPAGVTREGVMRLDAEMLTLWREQLEPEWVPGSLPAVRRALRKVWR